MIWNVSICFSQQQEKRKKLMDLEIFFFHGKNFFLDCKVSVLVTGHLLLQS